MLNAMSDQPTPKPAPDKTPSAGSAVPGWWLDFLLLSAIWGSSFLFMRLALPEFGALPTAGARVLLGALFLLPLVLWRGQGPVLRQHWRHALAVGVLNSGLPFVCFAYALASITTGLSAILNATTPLFGALVAWWWFGDRLNASRLLGLGLGFIGVALLAGGGAPLLPGQGRQGTPWLAILACLVATLCYGIAASFARRYLAGLPSLVTAAGSQLGASLFLLLPTLWALPAQMPGTRAWLAMLACGLLCTGLAYLLYFRLIARAGPARALTVTFAVPVFAIAYGVLFLNEPVTPAMVGCGLIIVCGTALSVGLLRLPRLAHLPGLTRSKR